MSDVEKDLREEVRDEVEAEAGTEDELAEVAIEENAQAEAQVEAGPTSKVESATNRETLGQGETSLTEAKLGPSSSERTWAALAHASVLVTFALGISTGGLAVVLAALVPLVIWLSFRDRSPFVAFHAMQATVFQLAALVAWLGLLVAGLVILIPTWIATILLVIILIGLLLLPVAIGLTIALPTALVILPFASLVYGLYGAFEVYTGREFRYWRIADWIESRGVRLAS